MKVSHKSTVIELDDEERSMLHSILCIAIEMCNESMKKERVDGILVRAGVDYPREARDMGEFADRLSDLL